MTTTRSSPRCGPAPAGTCSRELTRNRSAPPSRAAANGEIIFGTQLAARVLTYFTTGPSAPPLVFPQLTDREREVLDLVAQGRANPAIAAKLGLSQKTVRNHVSNILTKLQVADRAQAIVQARDAGLGQQSRRLKDIRAGPGPFGSADSSRVHRDLYPMTTGHPPAEAVIPADIGS